MLLYAYTVAQSTHLNKLPTVCETLHGSPIWYDIIACSLSCRFLPLIVVEI
jgi:hypothetical protein